MTTDARPIVSPKVCARMILLGAAGFAAAAVSATAPAAAQDAASAAIPQAGAAMLAVTTDPVRRETVSSRISGTGLVAPWQEAVVGAGASGLAITEVLVSEGDRVAAGAVLARLDDSLLKAEIAEKEAALASAEASHQAALSANDRGMRLARSGSLSSETLEVRDTTVRTTASMVAQVAAQLETLKVQLSRTVITAPFAGIVSAEPAVVGVMVQAGTEIARIQRDGRLRARIDVPEQHLARLTAGDAAEIVAPSGEKIAGRLLRVGESVDSVTHLGRAEIELAQSPALRAGMFVAATITAGGDTAMTVAQSALTWRDGRTAVFVVADDGRVMQTPVEASLRQDGRVVVEGALKEGQRVVTSGAGFLSDGNTVRVVTEAAAAAGQEHL